MMNSQEHLIAGFVASFLAGQFVGGLLEGFNVVFLMVFILLGVIGSVLPDMLEPPVGPWHRGFFHSWTVFFLIGVIALSLIATLVIVPRVTLAYFLLGLVTGYASHLTLDATTPASLPEI
ncbi:MAG: metal-dependent hydrolase [Candidatus Odinarchaeota archaeon]